MDPPGPVQHGSLHGPRHGRRRRSGRHRPAQHPDQSTGRRRGRGPGQDRGAAARRGQVAGRPADRGDPGRHRPAAADRPQQSESADGPAPFGLHHPCRDHAGAARRPRERQHREWLCHGRCLPAHRRGTRPAAGDRPHPGRCPAPGLLLRRSSRHPDRTAGDGAWDHPAGRLRDDPADARRQDPGRADRGQGLRHHRGRC